ncbi:MAG: hypothetical protein K1X94_10350 [Sandaracinaceae bacterium]|nr:hypothetical protein [Sandaracinaceae bacterium]
MHAELTEPEPRDDPRLYARIADLGVDARFTPLFALRSVAKSFDDALLARIEHLAHEGMGTYRGLYDVLGALRVKLAVGTSARGLLDAAQSLVDDALPTDRVAALGARKHLAPFQLARERSTPIGFYTRSDALRRIFRHDRLLQTPLEAETREALAAALGEDSTLRADYERHLALVAGVTNRFALPSVLAPEDRRGNALLPASTARENEILEELFASTAPPSGFSLVGELVSRIRDGRLDTAPRSDEGFYVHQLHAAASLLRPETTGLTVGPRYRAFLEQAFRAAFTTARESHAKQLNVAAGAAIRIVVTPEISLEPLPEHYRRTADAYAFLRETLTCVLGHEALAAAFGSHDARTLDDALRAMIHLFRGAEAVAKDELGLTDVDADARAVFRDWQSRSATEPAFTEDVRVAVPLFHDRSRRTYRISALIGLQRRRWTVSYATTPKLQVLGEDAASANVSFGSRTETLIEPVTIEVDVREVPTRETLRAICDRERSIDAICAALVA